MGTEKTAWHPPFIGMLDEFGPRWTHVSGEVRVASELRADGLIEVVADAARDPSDLGRVLRGMWPHLVWVGLVEFKSVSRAFRRGDLWRLFAYGFAWLASHTAGDALRTAPEGRRAAVVDDLTLFLVVPRRNPALDAELAELGLTPAPLSAGYHAVRGALIRTVLVELGTAGEAERDELMQWFAGVAARCSLATRRWIGQHTAGQGAMNATPALEGWEDWLARYLQSLSPAERVAGLAPEERMAGLSRDELILALPDDLLRAQPESVIASLSPEAQARVRARIAR
ncbi:MAG: hypothetical protein U0324_09255 [Polyangiales bacterium]